MKTHIFPTRRPQPGLARWYSLLFVLCSGFISPAFAETVRCTFSNIPNSYYVASEVELVLEDFGKEKVVDRVILATGVKAVFGEVETDSSKRLTLQWKVKNIKKDPKDTEFWDKAIVVRLTIQKASRSAVMNVSSVRSKDWSYRVEGQCDG